MPGKHFTCPNDEMHCLSKDNDKVQCNELMVCQTCFKKINFTILQRKEKNVLSRSSVNMGRAFKKDIEFPKGKEED